MTLPPGLHDAGRGGTGILLFLPPKPLGGAPLIGFYSSGEVGSVRGTDGYISKFSHMMTSFALLGDS